MLRKMPKCNKMYNHLEFYNPDGSVTPCCHFDKGKTEFGWNSYIPNLKYFEWYDMKERMKDGWILNVIYAKIKRNWVLNQ